MAQQMAPEVDIAALQRLRGMVDQLRDNLRKADREISSKNSEIDEVEYKLATPLERDFVWFVGGCFSTPPGVLILPHVKFVVRDTETKSVF
ncbi:hypothetical protein J6590_071852 [Homalodisca vitripennis]|nr:hypothetical protein J6590_071852 [Homalodisca vitripennis]